MSKSQLPYLDNAQAKAPALQKEHFTVTIYSMGIRAIEESLGLEQSQQTLFSPRTGRLKLSDPERIEAMLDLVEAFTCVSRKRIRLLDVRGFKDAGKVLRGFHHVATHLKSVNISAVESARSPWSVASFLQA